MKRTRTFSTKPALIFGGTDDPFERPPDGLRLLVTLEQPRAAGLADGGEVDPADQEVGIEIDRPGERAGRPGAKTKDPPAKVTPSSMPTRLA